jgi:3-oxoacyl-[acyl-carrier-protein] synthase-3
VLGPVADGRGVLASAFFTDTTNYDAVRLRGGGSSFPYAGKSDPAAGPNPGFMDMNSVVTWKQVVTHLPPTVRRACSQAGWSTDDVDLFVFHQANFEIINYVMKKMRVPMSHTFTNVQEIGNTGAASIPVALADAVAAGRLSPGDRVVLAGVGAGFGFGAVCMIWDGETRE